MQILEVTASPGVPFELGQVVAHRANGGPGVVVEIDGEVLWVASIYDCDGILMRAMMWDTARSHEPDELEAAIADDIRERRGLN